MDWEPDNALKLGRISYRNKREADEVENGNTDGDKFISLFLIFQNKLNESEI